MYEARQVDAELKMDRPEFAQVIADFYGTVGGARKDMAAWMTSFPIDVPMKFDLARLEELRTVPPSMIRAFIQKKSETSSVVDDLTVFKWAVGIPEFKISFVKDMILFTMGDLACTFDPFTGLFNSKDRDTMKGIVSNKKNVTVVIDNPPFNLLGSIRHLLSVYQMSTKITQGKVNFSFSKKNYPHMPPIDPMLIGPHGNHFVDDYVGPISKDLNSLELLTNPQGIASNPEWAILDCLLKKYGKYSRIPVIVAKSRGTEVNFSALVSKYSARWNEIVGQIRALNTKLAVDTFVTKNSILVPSCEEKLERSRAYRMLHVSMDKATHRSVDFVPGTECLDDAFSSLVKDMYLLNVYLGKNPNIDTFVLIGAELSMIRAMISKGKIVHVFDTITPSGLPDGIKYHLVDSLYSLTESEILKKIGPAPCLFVLCKGPIDLSKKLSGFHQNLDLYSWFFSLPWRNAIAKVYFPGAEIPSVMRPAFARSGFQFVDCGRLHNNECFIIFGGPPYNETGIRGNYTVGVVRAAYLIHTTNDLRNSMIHNGIVVLKRSFVDHELLLNAAIGLIRPTSEVVRNQMVDMEYDLDPSFQSPSDRSKRKGDEETQEEESQRATADETALVLRGGVTDNNNVRALVPNVNANPAPATPGFDDESMEQSHRPKIAATGTRGRGRGRGRGKSSD